MKPGTRAALAALAMTVASTPAPARRFIIPLGLPSFGGGGAVHQEQQIDLVRMLPDRPEFRRDGEHFDLGYLYVVTREPDGSTSNDKGTSNRYVLYHGEHYMELDSDAQAALVRALGDDPIAAHRAQIEAEFGHRLTTATRLLPREGESQDAFRARVKARFGVDGPVGPAPTPADAGTVALAPSPPHAMGLPALIGAVLSLALFVTRRSIRHALFGRAAQATAAVEPKEAPADHASFDERVAARLRELHGAAPQPPAEPMPTVRGFGRRVG